MTNSPVVSMVISAYNAESYIGDAVSSILRGNFTELELIVVDDGSTDRTTTVLSGIRDGRLTLLENERNRGVAFSFNRAIRESSGKYIAFLGADDISLPYRLQTQYEFMESRPDIDICGGWMEKFGDETGVIRLPVNDAHIRTQLLWGCCMAHPTVIMRRDTVLRHSLYYDENLSSAVDYDLWARAIDVAKFHNIPEILVRYRVHSEQISVARKKEQEAMAQYISENLLISADMSPTPAQKKMHQSLARGFVRPQTIDDMELFVAWINKMLHSEKMMRRHPLLKKYLKEKINVMATYESFASLGWRALCSFMRTSFFDYSIPLARKTRFMIRSLYHVARSCRGGNA